jgi:quinol monooxygenase YgiN
MLCASSVIALAEGTEMEDIGQPYTVGIWTVKPGKEAEFIQAWREFAEWTSKQGLGVGTGRLVQDTENPRRFISFGPWPSVEVIEQWRAMPEFKAFFEKVRELCDEIQPRTLKLVAHS